MTLDQLKMFITVARLGTLKTASEELHKTQAAVSQGISKLEAQLAVQLFHRNQYRLRLTEEGAAIFEQCQRVLAEAGQLTQLAHHFAQGNETQITIAFEASFNLQKLLPVLADAQARHPKTQFILRQEYLSGAVECLKNQRADIALTPVANQLMETLPLTSIPLYQGALVTTVSPKLLARHRHLSSAQQLINEYQILVKDSGTATGDINLGVQSGQRHWHVTDFSTKKMLILSGMGWGKLPDFLIEKELASGELVRLELPDLSTSVYPNYCLLRSSEKRLGPVAQSLWDEIAKLRER